ncbi:MAG: DUF5752 family protein [Thermoproteota archaeon]|nr:hypothetical protein [Candidatus Brockarchaeota archaeon]MBO3801013.1 hypothetical protein [Candidatus Brockarchaeota archaeon]
MAVLSPGDYLTLIAHINERGETDVNELSSSTGVTKRDLVRAIKVLKKNMAVDFYENKIKLTELGKFALEKKDIKIVFGYVPGEKVPDYLSFKFFLGEGLFSGEVASSYSDFLEVIKRIDTRSILFHLYRGDFDKWFSDVFKDKKLAKKIAALKNKLMAPNRVRDRLIRVLEQRLSELKEGK